MSLDFIPRKLQKRTAKQTANFANEIHQLSEPRHSQISHERKGKQKANQDAVSEEAISTCLTLAFSDYTLSRDEGVRALISNAGEEEFIPLSRLIARSNYLTPFSNVGQLIVVRLLRTLFPTVEVRMKLDEPSTSRSGQTITPSGGYEVRCAAWRTAVTQEWNEGYWEKRTVYIENIPHTHRTPHSIVDFLKYIAPEGRKFDIQSITFPSHHSDRPCDIPRFKGFAFIVLSDLKDARSFCSSWPWDYSSELPKAPQEDKSSSEADQTGFRALVLSKWIKLRDEYLDYQVQLLDIAREQPSPNALKEDHHHPGTSSIYPPKLPSENTEWYPRGCLVFVKHIHPETNKTTLRKLFRQFTSSSEGDCVDYLDYQKGVDSCLVRFKLASEAQAFRAKLVGSPVCQRHGLDENGSTRATAEGHKPLEAESVTGAREEVYWETIPQKIRDQCLSRQGGVFPPPSASNAPSANGIRKLNDANEICRPTTAIETSYPELQNENAWFPRGCLLFVKNIDPGTNKTTLRKLFTRALYSPQTDSNSERSEDRIDYVDYQKGLDTCYIRLHSAIDTESLHDAVVHHPFRQTGPLDGSGESLPPNSSTSEDLSCIRTEMVAGPKEELYWEKIPEKVRLAALVKTEAQTRHPKNQKSFVIEDPQVPQADPSQKKRKRR